MSPHIQLSEEQLIALLKNREERAFNYLYDHYSGAIYGLILRIVTSEEHAQEVIQDVFVKIWKYIDQYDASKGRFYTWMINISRNTAIDYLKSKGYQNEQKNQSISIFVSKDEARLSAGMNNPADKDADLIGMNTIINGLKPEWRELIELAYFQGYSQSEIAEMLDIPIGTVKTRTRNALLELKGLLKDYQ
ncbi:RNA polymerase sigma factor [Taishania pollutisoli]|uniref:RNA polymerase sigma factor n=1 Tax=Taishania pollutisoli TaxID=2766479 RepID=UPI001F40973D|nr:sigma-70 family RNA polymerase sigma factor [Taishania pollutisoli]